MAHYVGDTISNVITLVDDDNVAITGASFTVTTRDPDDNSFTVTVTELGSGDYRVSFAPDAAGEWYIRLSYAGPPVRTFAGSFDVDAEASVVSSPSTALIVNGVTRRDIRRRVLTKLGDLIIVTATEAGSPTTLVDRVHLTGEPDAYRGREILFTGGTALNIGEQRYVTGSARSNRSLTVDYDLPTDTQTGDEAELINMRGTGYRFNDIQIAIDAAVESASGMAPEHVIWEVEDLYDKDTGTIEIPDEWIGVSAVDWREASDQPWQALDFHQKRLGSGWTIDRARRLINIGGERSRTLHGRAVRIYGLRNPSAIPNDDDVTGINAEWLVARVVSELSSAAYRRSPTPERRDMLSYDLENERIIRTRVTKRSAAIRL